MRESRLSEDRGKSDVSKDEMIIEEEHKSILKARNNSKNKGADKDDSSVKTRQSAASILPMNRRVGQWQKIDNWLWVNNQIEF